MVMQCIWDQIFWICHLVVVYIQSHLKFCPKRIHNTSHILLTVVTSYDSITRPSIPWMISKYNIEAWAGHMSLDCQATLPIVRACFRLTGIALTLQFNLLKPGRTAVAWSCRTFARVTLKCFPSWLREAVWKPILRYVKYRQTSNIIRTLVGNEIVDHSDVVGASPAGAASTTSPFST